MRRLFITHDLLISRCAFWLTCLFFAGLVDGCTSEGRQRVYREGDHSMRGGSPTIRQQFTPEADDPSTTDDESNDQPRGHFGTATITVTSQQSGNTYTLDADIDDGIVTRIYFPRGGWVDFPYCDLDADISGDCDDEEGRTWTFEGPSSDYGSSTTEDDSDFGNDFENSDSEE